MSKKAELYTAIAEAFAALAGLEATEDGKSLGGAVDAVAGGAAGKGKKGAASDAVAAKPAGKSAKGKAAAVTFDVLKAKLTELVSAKGKEAVKEILSDFGAPKLVDLAESDYPAAYAQAVAAIAADEEEETTEDDDDMFGS